MIRILFLLATSCAYSTTPNSTSEIVIVILSQSCPYNLKLAQNLKLSIQEQADSLSNENISVYVHLSHEDFQQIGHWAIVPILPKLVHLHGEHSSWIIFIEDRTEIRLRNLLIALNKYEAEKEWFVGHRLVKIGPVNFHYKDLDLSNVIVPNIECGVALSTTLLKRLTVKFRNIAATISSLTVHPAFLLTFFIMQAENGPMLHHDPRFCITDELNCATNPQPFHACDDPITRDSIYFAVKTCLKFHKTRVPIVKSTWAKHPKVLKFFSDTEDDAIPSIRQNLSDPNELCLKTMDTISLIAKELPTLPDVRWIIITDDDTMISVTRLQQLLTCYNESLPTALGLRGGYDILKLGGFDFLSMGSGMVMSRILVELLTQPGACVCPKDEPAPDDVQLGICLAMLGIEVTHSPLFHNARPTDYDEDFLKIHSASVSFHGCKRMSEMKKFYEDWFRNDDLKDPTIRDKKY